MISLDANAVIGLMKATNRQLRLRYREAMAAGETIIVSSIALHELHYGVSRSAREQDNRASLAGFMSGPVAPLHFDEEDARVAGEVRASLAARGTPIGPYDVLIAGQALRHGATLVTANTREFGRVEGLKVEDWGAARL